jgi:predicted glycogen debranching enzyme
VRNIDLGKSKEWVVANGLGSYASSTIIGLNTRGYHGLLIASLDPPVRRMLFLSKYEEEVLVDGKKFLLAVNNYPNTTYPTGYQYLEQFRFERYPVFVYHIGNTILEKSVFMPYGDNTTITSYRVIESDSPVQLSIFPIINYRDYHSRTMQDSRWNFAQALNPKGTEIRAFPGATTLYLQSDIGAYNTSGYWYKNFVYQKETERGIQDREDQYNPGYFVAKLERGTQLSLLASLRRQDTFSPEGVRYREMQRVRALVNNLPQTDQFFIALANAADTFIVSRKSTNSKSIIAGYHWFADWGRDSMISIPGLTLVTKREEEGQQIIKTFLSYLSDGLIPNTFPESDSSKIPEYNAMDAPLWLINACYMMYSETGALDSIKEVYRRLAEIVSSYKRGTKHGIQMDSDGLVKGGDGSVALTWMDGHVGGVPVTPRAGKPVEISALWFNALKIMESFAKALGKSQEEEDYKTTSEKVGVSFNEKFWNESSACLYDYLVDDKGDPKVRPNQIFAVSLPFPVLKQDRWKDVLRTIDSELLTPVGLRTLSPSDPEYKKQYIGGKDDRDRAYHQGTVWPWLFGAYVTAYVKTYGTDPKTLAFIQQLYAPFKKRMEEAGIGTLSEIYDGDPPHYPRGCISQAWSVAEILRSYVRDANQM